MSEPTTPGNPPDPDAAEAPRLTPAAGAIRERRHGLGRGRSLLPATSAMRAGPMGAGLGLILVALSLSAGMFGFSVGYLAGNARGEAASRPMVREVRTVRHIEGPTWVLPHVAHGCDRPHR